MHRSKENLECLLSSVQLLNLNLIRIEVTSNPELQFEFECKKV